MLRGKLLLPLFALLYLAGCQTTPPGDETAPAEPPRPEKSLDQRWQESIGDPQLLESLLGRIQGATLRKRVRNAVASARNPGVAVNRLNKAGSHARQARAIVAELYGYRRAGGVALNTIWERDLWKRLKEQSARSGAPVKEVSDTDIAGAQRSLAAQVAKAWFYEKGVQKLRQRAEEIHELQKQLLEREQTSKRLERGNHGDLMAIRKELARADARVKQLKRAEALAHKALVALTGDSRVSVSQKGSVTPVPGGLPLSLLINRPDVSRAARGLADAGLIDEDFDMLLPDTLLTAKGGRASRALSEWSRMKPEAMADRLDLESRDGSQAAAVEHFSRVLRAALKEVGAMLRDGRQLVGQRSSLQGKEQEARRIVNRFRARYSARRADLTDIIEAQQVLAEIAGKLAYVQNRVFGQRLDAYLALGGAGF